MMTHQKGFTLIELVAVIVILGALAVVALPRFLDLQDEAEQAATDGVAGALSSAYAVNYAAFLSQPDSNSVPWGTARGVDQWVEFKGGDNTENVTQTENSLLNGNPLTQGNYTITGCDDTSTDPGDTIDCTLVSEDGNKTATFTLIYTE